MGEGECGGVTVGKVVGERKVKKEGKGGEGGQRKDKGIKD